MESITHFFSSNLGSIVSSTIGAFIGTSAGAFLGYYFSLSLENRKQKTEFANELEESKRGLQFMKSYLDIYYKNTNEAIRNSNPLNILSTTDFLSFIQLKVPTSKLEITNILSEWNNFISLLVETKNAYDFIQIQINRDKSSFAQVLFHSCKENDKRKEDIYTKELLKITEERIKTIKQLSNTCDFLFKQLTNFIDTLGF